MLNLFYVENYKNIKMKDDLYFNSGNSFVYGACGSGKTNLCIALADICMHGSIMESENKDGAEFRYGFKVLDCQIWFKYTRNRQGEPYNIKIELPQLMFCFIERKAVSSISEVCELILKLDISEHVKKVIYALKQEIYGWTMCLLYLRIFFVSEMDNPLILFKI